MGSLLHMREHSIVSDWSSFIPWKSNDNNNHGGFTPREWNAFIGIVTAIVGNIFISFALNLQRYAHIRLDQDRQQRQKLWASSKNKQAAKSVGYGTQEEIAERRADINREAPPLDEEDEDHQAKYHQNGNGHNETTPMLADRSRSVSPGSVTQAESQDEFKPQNYLKSGWWWAGIILMIVGEAGNFLAYGFAPASIVSPLGVVAIISNCIIAPCLLKEQFRQRDFWGVLIAVGGTVTIVLSAENNEAKLGPHKIWRLITQWEFELYLGLTVLAIIVLMWASGNHGHKSILIDIGLVGLFGGYTALTTKGIASLLSDTLWRVITFPVTYLLLFILVFTALMQIRYINRALQRFDSTQVIPTQFVLFTLSVIIGSAVLYRDFEEASGARYGKFIGGCALTFTGVYCITSGRKRGVGDDDDDDDDEFDDEEGIRLVDEEAQEYETRPVEDPDATPKPTQGEIQVFDSNKQFPGELSRQQSGASTIPRTPTTPQRTVSDPSSIRSVPYTPQNLGTPLHENPWLSEERVGATQSNPTLVTPPAHARHSIAGSLPRPGTPQMRSTSNLGVRGSTDELRNSLKRKSMSHMLPGPLISPLSSSLTGIVQDNLRRGVDSPLGSRRKRRSGLSRLRVPNGSEEVANPSETVLPTQRSEQADEGVKKKRSHSLSDALGGLFKKRGNKSKKSLHTDEEAQALVGDEQEQGESSRH